MQNKYEKESNLTEYDLFMLQKRNSGKVRELKECDTSSIKSRNINEMVARPNYDEEYNKYMLQQLNRQTPTKLLTRQEFINNYFATATDSSNICDTTGVLTMDKSEYVGATNQNERKRNKFFGNVQFKKGGKVLLILYVIIVLAVAFTLLVLNSSSNDGLISADAQSNVNQSVGKEEVGAMVLEKEDESASNWFDRLCDALNK